MAFDYAPLAATALELVTEFGKTVTLRRLDAAAPDAAMPWRGPVNPRTTPGATLEVAAVFVEPGSLQKLGVNAEVLDWVPRSQQIAIVASQADLAGVGDPLYSELIDTDASLWRVTGVSTLNPGGTRLLHFVGVSR